MKKASVILDSSQLNTSLAMNGILTKKISENIFLLVPSFMSGILRRHSGDQIQELTNFVVVKTEKSLYYDLFTS